MSVPAALSVATDYQKLQCLQTAARISPTTNPDAALVQFCAKICEEQQGHCQFDAIEPEDWESYDRVSATLRNLTHTIAATPATSHRGLRAKALALCALLDDGNGELYEDAAAPDVLAWSLVQDILAG